MKIYKVYSITYIFSMGIAYNIGWSDGIHFTDKRVKNIRNNVTGVGYNLDLDNSKEARIYYLLIDGLLQGWL